MNPDDQKNTVLIVPADDTRQVNNNPVSPSQDPAQGIPAAPVTPVAPVEPVVPTVPIADTPVVETPSDGSVAPTAPAVRVEEKDQIGGVM